MSLRSKAATALVAGLLATGISVGASTPAQAYVLQNGAICRYDTKVLDARSGKTKVTIYRWVDLRYLGGGWFCSLDHSYIYYKKVW